MTENKRGCLAILFEPAADAAVSLDGRAVSKIPASLPRDADGTASFDWTPIRRICAENGIDPEIFSDAPEDNVSTLLVAWYSTHRARGGEPDPVADDLLADVLAKEALGAGISHAPGRA